MIEKVDLQIQSVIYGNEKKNLLKTMDALANAIAVERREMGLLGNIYLRYGDATESAILSEDEIEAIKEKYRDYFEFNYIYFGFNSGSARGHNILGENCKSEYMMIMNPDVIVSPRYFIEIMRPFLVDGVGMVEARQTPVEHQKDYDIQTGETGWATTACAVVLTKLFHELDGFDSETFFLYCDDLDFSWRIRLLGYKIIYQPLAPVFHAKTLNMNGSWKPSKAERYYSAEAALLMAYKWSNMSRLEILLRNFKTSNDEFCKKAAIEFEKKRSEGSLPKQIDGEHKIGQFLGNYYSRNRFIL